MGATGTIDLSGLTSTQLVGKTLMHGVAGGVMGDLQGGKFGHGFVSAGVTQAASPQLGEIRGLPQQVIAAAVVGGTISAATGGKFANGAITAAFSRAFNECAHNGCWVSDKERALSEAGDYKGYYEEASKTDPYARRAGQVAMGIGDSDSEYWLSKLTNLRLRWSLLDNQSGGLPMNRNIAAEYGMESIRVDLMRAHVAALDRAGATASNPVMLDRDRDIGQFHRYVFSQHGASPDVFGGATWDKLGAAGRYFYDWCPSPSCKP